MTSEQVATAGTLDKPMQKTIKINTNYADRGIYAKGFAKPADAADVIVKGCGQSLDTGTL